MAWKALLIKLGDLRIPRYMYCSSSVKGVQLHVFVDASLDAYAAVAYLRVKHGGEIRCSLVASRNRVAPLKPISVPRMELMAAVLGLRLAKFLESELSTKIEKRIFWTDARDVLYWIKSDARKYPQFVALRIGEILEGSEIEDWRWVPSEQNVADEGTKWTKKCEINSSARWFTGPEFLLQGESQWPSRAGVDISSECELMYHDEETRVNKSPIDSIMPDPLRFSRLERLRAAQKRVLDFLRYICKEPRGPELVRLFKVKRYVEMDTVFIRACQEEAFADEIRCLKKGDCVTNRKSTIFKLSPYLDAAGVLRMQGRIEAIEDVEVNVKHPIILPSRHRVTYLIVGYYHRKYHHLHGEIVVNEIRQQYWIPGLRVLVKDIVKNCSACCIRRAQPLPPIMGNLPKERLSPFSLPFTYTTRTRGLFRTNGNRRRKTCLLLAEVFLLRCCQTTEVESKYPEMSFAFIPPGSPHMGGAWERMVRSTKSILTEILAHAGLREEVLRAALADAADETSKRNSWPKGIVAEVHCGKDGQVRSAVVRTTEGFVTRPAVKLAKLDIVMDGNT
ncbi:uncharacterized protein [Drosophila kikkawai]|uniref:Integrase zinc-binding domain-containing protein n=1 Tax=Drosophila kikkawai TaxID=30033 RepID=A0ABM3C753_DROKI|nr:uncharacterized protein LOC121502752 [Drosophila kikkawai]